jgi:hypothetical protein
LLAFCMLGGMLPNDGCIPSIAGVYAQSSRHRGHLSQNPEPPLCAPTPAALLTGGKHLDEACDEHSEAHDETFRFVQHDSARQRDTVPSTTATTSKRVWFEVVTTESGLGFDPTDFSERCNALCPFCGSTVGNDYVKAEGKDGRMGTQPTAVVCTRRGKQGKVHLSADELSPALLPDDAAVCAHRDMGFR